MNSTLQPPPEVYHVRSLALTFPTASRPPRRRLMPHLSAIGPFQNRETTAPLPAANPRRRYRHPPLFPVLLTTIRAVPPHRVSPCCYRCCLVSAGKPDGSGNEPSGQERPPSPVLPPHAHGGAAETAKLPTDEGRDAS
ncbi:hypothetical protein LX36DRAFT_234934 [Colletotrichum falcatum]|nr:hypothetical protein LX36DRAFT_234934 [Colletotrichum falcatum]